MPPKRRESSIRLYNLFINSSLYNEEKRSIINNNDIEFETGKQLNNVTCIKLKNIRLRQSWTVLLPTQREFSFKQIEKTTGNETRISLQILDSMCTVETINDFINIFNKLHTPQMHVDTTGVIRWYSKDEKYSFLIEDTPLSRLLGVRHFERIVDKYNIDSALVLPRSVPHQYIRPELYIAIDFPIDSNLNSKSLNICYTVCPNSSRLIYVDQSEHVLVELQQPIRRIRNFRIQWYYADGTPANLYYTDYSMQIVFYYHINKEF